MVDLAPREGPGARAGGDGRLRTCTILTTAANSAIATLHDRMPVILPAGAEDAWLDTDNAASSLTDLLAGLDPGRRRCRPSARPSTTRATTVPSASPRRRRADRAPCSSVVSCRTWLAVTLDITTGGVGTPSPEGFVGSAPILSTMP